MNTYLRLLNCGSLGAKYSHLISPIISTMPAPTTWTVKLAMLPREGRNLGREQRGAVGGVKWSYCSRGSNKVRTWNLQPTSSNVNGPESWLVRKAQSASSLALSCLHAVFVQYCTFTGCTTVSLYKENQHCLKSSPFKETRSFSELWDFGSFLAQIWCQRVFLFCFFIVYKISFVGVLFLSLFGL